MNQHFQHQDISSDLVSTWSNPEVSFFCVNTSVPDLRSVQFKWGGNWAETSVTPSKTVCNVCACAFPCYEKLCIWFHLTLRLSQMPCSTAFLLRVWGRAFARTHTRRERERQCFHTLLTYVHPIILTFMPGPCYTTVLHPQHPFQSFSF